MSKPARAAGWLAVLALGLGPPLLREANSDAAWHLYMAGRLLHGERQGVNLIEVNPPLITWVSLPAAWIHQFTGISPWTFWVLMVGVAAVASLLLVRRLLPMVEASEDRRRSFLWVAAFTILVLPRLDFSEREHLAAILTLPFTVLAAARLAGARVSRGTAVFAGISGGIGFSLKPHFLLAWVLIEAALLIGLGGNSVKREELWAILGFGAIYAALVLVLYPDYLPMALRLAPLYSSYLDNGLLYAAGLAGPYLLYLAVAGLALRVAGRRSDPLIGVLTAACLGFLAAAILQRKGFSYHYISALGFGILLLFRGWHTRPSRISWSPSGIILRLGFLVLPTLPLLSIADAARELYQPEHRRYRLDASYLSLLPHVERLAAHEAILVLSSNPNAGWPLALDAKAEWASRYVSLWPLVALYDDQLRSPSIGIVSPTPFASRTGFERRFSDEFMEDLAHYRPRLIVVLLPDGSERLWGGSRRFDYLEYFSSDPRFRDFMTEYREVSRVGTYTLWLKSGVPGEPRQVATDRI